MSNKAKGPHICGQDCGCGTWDTTHRCRGLTHGAPEGTYGNFSEPSGRTSGRISLDVIEENWEEHR